MAFEENKISVTLPASGNLSASQYCFVEVNSSGQAAVAGDGAHADGILQNDPAAAGRAAEVAIGGVVKVLCGGVVTRGGPVGSDAAGKAVNAASGDIILGTALETGANGAIIAMLFHPRGAVPAT
jgi:hypothetical protein